MKIFTAAIPLFAASLATAVLTNITQENTLLAVAEHAETRTTLTCFIRNNEGEPGPMAKHHWKYQDDIPGYPYIAGWSQIDTDGEKFCGTCLRLSYNGRSRNVLAVTSSTGKPGVTIPQRVMTDLTSPLGLADGNGIHPSVMADVQVFSPETCHMGHRGRAKDIVGAVEGEREGIDRREAVDNAGYLA